jgi:hypothetical protein
VDSLSKCPNISPIYILYISSRLYSPLQSLLYYTVPVTALQVWGSHSRDPALIRYNSRIVSRRHFSVYRIHFWFARTSVLYIRSISCPTCLSMHPAPLPLLQSFFLPRSPVSGTHQYCVACVLHCTVRNPAPLLYIRPLYIYILLLIFIQDQQSRSVSALLHFLFSNRDNYTSPYLQVRQSFWYIYISFNTNQPFFW